jgi:hypothetical protein
VQTADESYFAARAAEHRSQALRARDEAARDAHRRLATEYACKAVRAMLSRDDLFA